MGKTCIKCGKEEPEVVFSKYKHTCRRCQSLLAVEWAKKNPDRKREANKRYLSTPLGNLSLRRKTKKFRKKFPNKYAAYIAVQSAIRSGVLIRKPCEVCGNHNSHGHHDDYGKPLDVIWLCDICHVRLHRAMLAEDAAHEKGVAGPEVNDER